MSPQKSCICMCKMCRVPDGRHCGRAGLCYFPTAVPQEEEAVAEALRQLRATSGSHSPSLIDINGVLPGLIKVDACFLSNPYATEAVLNRLGELSLDGLDRIVSHYPSQSESISARLAHKVGVPAEYFHVSNGASEVIQALLANVPGPMLIAVPTFSAYYEFAQGEVITHQLDRAENFTLDLAELEQKVRQHRPTSVVIINPNNPDGGYLPESPILEFIEKVEGKVEQVIVDESFAHFTTESGPAPTFAPFVCQFPHLVVVNSMSKSHGIAGLRLGWAAMIPERVTRVRSQSLWNINGFGEWFCDLLSEEGFEREYESARQRYVRDTRRFLADLATIDGAKVYPSKANYALLELDRPAAEVTSALLARHGVYVRDCADKRGLQNGDRFIRVAARSMPENDQVLAALADVLANC